MLDISALSLRSWTVSAGGEAFETAEEFGLRIADKLMGPVEDALFGGCKGLLHGVRDALEDTSL